MPGSLQVAWQVTARREMRNGVHWWRGMIYPVLMRVY